MFVYFVAVGPGHTGTDAIESVLKYKQKNSTLIVLNDTKSEFSVAENWVDCEIFMPTKVPSKYAQIKSTYGLLYYKKILLLDYAASKFPEAEGYIYLDDDALLIREGLEHVTSELFQANPKIGIAGAYKLSAKDASPRDFEPVAKTISLQTGLVGLIRNRTSWKLVRTVLKRAKRNGYILGEHVLGGALIFSATFVNTLVKDELFLSPIWADVNVPEDACFALACCAAGFSMHDFSLPGDPLAIQWRGLSAEPDELIQSGKYLIHSTDFSAKLQQKEILDYFRAQRKN